MAIFYKLLELAVIFFVAAIVFSPLFVGGKSLELEMEKNCPVCGDKGCFYH